MRGKNWRKGKVHQEKMDRMKRDLCFALQRIYFREHYTRPQMALRIGTSLSRLSLVLSNRVEKLTFDQLVTYLVIAEVRFEMLIAI
ncbi:MAG: hypothetical protein ACXVA9_06470 [Bdellovibrionales bacterium]